jgi:hypothetical protein
MTNDSCSIVSLRNDALGILVDMRDMIWIAMAIELKDLDNFI